MDKLILRNVSTEREVILEYPVINFYPSHAGYLYFSNAHESLTVTNATGFISVGNGWWSELIKGE